VSSRRADLEDVLAFASEHQALELLAIFVWNVEVVPLLALVQQK